MVPGIFDSKDHLVSVPRIKLAQFRAIIGLGGSSIH